MQNIKRQIAGLVRDRNEDRRQLAQQQGQLAQQQGLLAQQQGQLAVQRGQINIMERDIKYLITQRAVTVSTQVLYEFIGEQPRRGQPCNFFSGLNKSKPMVEMLKGAFPLFQCSRARSDLLRRFDELADGRNSIAHPALDTNPVYWEIRHMLEFLRREQAKGTLDQLQETSLWILLSIDQIRACRPYPFGIGHQERQLRPTNGLRKSKSALA